MRSPRRSKSWQLKLATECTYLNFNQLEEKRMRCFSGPRNGLRCLARVQSVERSYALEGRIHCVRSVAYKRISGVIRNRTIPIGNLPLARSKAILRCAAHSPSTADIEAPVVQYCGIEDWKTELDRRGISRGAAVALGKFDAMHTGHR